MGVRRNFSRGGQPRHFVCPFQLADDAMQMDVHRTLRPLLHHQEKAPSYGSSHKMRSLAAIARHGTRKDFSRKGPNQNRISRPPYPKWGERCHRGPKFNHVTTEGLL